MTKSNSKITYNLSARRAAIILKCLGEAGRPLGITEISRELDLSASTVYRVVSALAIENLVNKDPDTKRYGISVRLYSLARGVFKHLGFSEQAKVELGALAKSAGETVLLGVLRQNRVIYLYSIESEKFLRTSVKVVSAHPAHTTAIGKVILAFSEESKVEEYIKTETFEAFTPGCIQSPEVLKERLNKIREDGFTFDDEECAVEVRAVGAPIRDATGEVIASVAVASPSSRMNDNQIPFLISDVMETARRISCTLGWDDAICYQSRIIA